MTNDCNTWVSLRRCDYPDSFVALGWHLLEGRKKGKQMKRTLLILCILSCIAADYNTKNQSNIPKNRTGISQPFGNGTITNRSDGSANQTRAFGNGTITTETTRGGQTKTGISQPFGSGTITNWSNGTTTTSRPFGSSTIVTERSTTGKTTTAIVQPLGAGTNSTRWSNGTTNNNRAFGNGTINTDTK